MVRKKFGIAKLFNFSNELQSTSSSENPRLLFVVNDPDFFLSHRLILAEAAKRAGFNVYVATPYGSGVTKIRSKGFNYIPLKLKRWSMNPISEVRTFFSLLEIYRKVQPHIVHNVTIKPVLYGSLAARVAAIPALVNAISGLGYVFISQGLPARLRRGFVQYVYKKVLNHRNSKVIFQNPDDRDYFVSNQLVEPGSIVTIKGSGVDVQKYKPVSREEEPAVVLMVARLLRDKGLYEFVEAARFLRRQGSNARFIVAGDPAPGNPAGVSDAQLEVWQKEGIVEFLGNCSDMPSIYGMSDVVCLPSYREGLPKALIEAASCGKALVATNVAGCREIVRQGVNGYLVTLGDSVGLARALETLLEDKDLRNKMGRNSREIILNEGFAEEQIAAKTLSVYLDLLKNVAELRYFNMQKTASSEDLSGSIQVH